MNTANQQTKLPATIMPWFRYWMLLFYGVLALAVLGYTIGRLMTRPESPDVFYSIALSADVRPGQLLRAEPVALDGFKGGSAWRILYATNPSAGPMRAASGLVVAGSRATDEPRPVIAWAHGATGIVPGCAPSMMSEPFDLAPAFQEALDAGWIWVAPDYPGLGTPGPHPYLVGPAQAHAVLDAVRAVQQMDDLRAAPQTVVWGHSQGGHAALWTGIEAPSYAPDVKLAGVVGIAPATELPDLLSAVHRRFLGRMRSAYLVQAYAAVYDDIEADAMLRPIARPLARDIAGRCLEGGGIAVLAVPTLLAMPTLFADVPPSGRFAERLAENVPDAPIPSPVLIVQGNRDTTVLPGIQGGFVARRCLAGQVIDYRGLDGEDHLSIVGADSALYDLLISWTHARLAGEPAPTRCRIQRQ